MKSNEELIVLFYTSFQNKDYKTMQGCYADNAEFSDAVFPGLNAEEVRAMWEMLIRRGEDLTLECKNVYADNEQGSADWIATYTFSKTGRKVVNHVKAGFLFENGKIIRHTDTFNFYRWAAQALGFTGLLLGWTSAVRTKIRKTAMQNLRDFMTNKPV